MGTLAIVGLGLIGSSMGLALRAAEPRNTEVIGYDRDPDVATKSHKMGAVQRLAPTLEAAVAEANMVIIATPIVNARKVFETIAPHLKGGAVITDTASTKQDILRWAREILPQNIHFVGGHPMAGKETSGPGSAEPGLFKDRPYCVVPSVDATPGAVSSVVGLAQAIGAKPFFLDAAEHDAYAAAISHVPLVASLALFNLARQSAAWPELAAMSGPAFKDLTRLASGSPEMSHDIFLTNRENLRHWLGRYVDQLQELSKLIATDEGEALFRTLAEAQFERDNFLLNPPEREDPGGHQEMPSANQSFMAMMAGSLWTDRAKDLTDSYEERVSQREREERMHRHVD